MKIFNKQALCFILPQNTFAVVFYPRALFKNKKTAKLSHPKIVIIQTAEVGEVYAERIRKFIGFAWVNEAGGNIREDLVLGRTINNLNLPLVKITRDDDEKAPTLQFLYLLYSLSSEFAEQTDASRWVHSLVHKTNDKRFHRFKKHLVLNADLPTPKNRGDFFRVRIDVENV